MKMNLSYIDTFIVNNHVLSPVSEYTRSGGKYYNLECLIAHDCWTPINDALLWMTYQPIQLKVTTTIKNGILNES